MNGYTKAKNVSSTRSRSIDFSDLSYQPKIPKPISNYSSNPSDSGISHGKKIPERSMDIPSPIQENENDDGVGEIFGVILSRKCSVSSTSSNNYISDQKEDASLQSAVKRVLSMKRSSSVSEGYCRIHHQCDPNAADDDESVTRTAFKTRSIKKKGKIFRACRRIFGF